MKTFRVCINLPEWYIYHIMEGFNKRPNDENDMLYEIGNLVASQLVTYISEYPKELTDLEIRVEISSQEL